MPDRRAIARGCEPSIHLSLDYDYGHLPYSSVAKATTLIVTLLSESWRRRSRIQHRSTRRLLGILSTNWLQKIEGCNHRTVGHFYVIGPQSSVPKWWETTVRHERL